MASLYLPKNSKTWRIEYWSKTLGRPTSKSCKTKDKVEANRVFKKFLAKEELGIIDEQFNQSKDTLFEAFEIFLSEKKRAENSKLAYRRAFKHLSIAIGNKFVAKIQKQDYVSFMKHLQNRVSVNHFNEKVSKKLGVNSIANYTRHVYAFMKWMLENKLITENFFKVEKGEKMPVNIIESDELVKIFDKLKKTSYEEIFRIIHLLALRANEITYIKKQDLNFKNRTITITNEKGNRSDVLPMIDEVETILKKRAEASANFLYNVTYEGMKASWMRVMNNLGLNYSIHDLRRTRGTELAEKGINAFYLKEYMRHTSLSTTEQYYIRINREKMRAEIERKETPLILIEGGRAPGKKGRAVKSA